MMSDRKFTRLVKEMRTLQKRFFGGEKTAEVVRHARDLERRVDRAVAEREAETGEQTESLF